MRELAPLLLHSLMRPDKSEVTAQAILDRYIEGVRADFASSVEAVVLIGSLATGGYVPGPGDIDQITILRQDAADGAANRLQACIDAASAAYGEAVHMAPIVHRRSDLERPWPVTWDLRAETRHLVTVPEELLRIHDHGQVRYGDPSCVADLPVPTREEILACHRRLRRWNRDVNRVHPRQDLANRAEISPRLAVQVILSRAIWHHFYATGSPCFAKSAIAGRLADQVPGYLFQTGVDLASSVRQSGSFEVSPRVERSLTRWCKRFLEWGTSHQPDDVPGVSLSPSKPEDEAPAGSARRGPRRPTS